MRWIFKRQNITTMVPHSGIFSRTIYIYFLIETIKWNIHIVLVNYYSVTDRKKLINLKNM